MEGDERTGTTRKNACNRETMVKIRLAIIFIIAQVVLTKYTNRRHRNRIVEDRAIRYNRNIEANCLSNILPQKREGAGASVSDTMHAAR